MMIAIEIKSKIEAKTTTQEYRHAKASTALRMLHDIALARSQTYQEHGEGDNFGWRTARTYEPKTIVERRN